LLNSNSTKGLVGRQRGKIIMAQAISANLWLGKPNSYVHFSNNIQERWISTLAPTKNLYFHKALQSWFKWHPLDDIVFPCRIDLWSALLLLLPRKRPLQIPHFWT
jgi:hypothetical protein